MVQKSGTAGSESHPCFSIFTFHTVNQPASPVHGAQSVLYGEKFSSPATNHPTDIEDVDPLWITSGLFYAAALLLPAEQSPGLRSIRGRGWMILFLAMILMAASVAAIAKAEGGKSLFYFSRGR